MSYLDKDTLKALQSISSSAAEMEAYNRSNKDLKLLRKYSLALALAINSLERAILGPHELIDHLLMEGVLLTPGADDLNEDLSKYGARVYALRRLSVINPETLMNRLRKFQGFLIVAMGAHRRDGYNQIKHVQNENLKRKASMDFELIDKSLTRKLRNKYKKEDDEITPEGKRKFKKVRAD